MLCGMTGGKSTCVSVATPSWRCPQGQPSPFLVPRLTAVLPVPHMRAAIAEAVTASGNADSVSLNVWPSLAPQGESGKMSASDPNSAVFVTDSPKDIKNKVRKVHYGHGCGGLILGHPTEPHEGSSLLLLWCYLFACLPA